MPETEPPIKKIYIAGAGLRGDGYPNAWNTVKILTCLDDLAVIDHSCWLPQDVKLWKLASGSKADALVGVTRIASSNLISLAKLLARTPARSLTYVPYPGIFILWLASWLPERIRPRFICDAYITVWDSLYQDRNLGNSKSTASRILLSIESRALRTAEMVVSDTTKNAEHISLTFGVARDRIRALPLALQPLPDRPRPPKKNDDDNRVNVIFVGTFVPLQGTTLIAKSIHALRNAHDIEFTLIGDGQQATDASPWLGANQSVTWLRAWQPKEVIAKNIEQSDICLGVFGGDGKAARVLPFKIYSALAAGKPVISQDNYGLPENTPPPPLMAISSDVDSLSSAIQTLANAPDQRREMGAAAAVYHQKYLSSEALTLIWKGVINKLINSTAPEQ
ncbi:glycosyltransferase [Stenotrophomonas terrae]|uniref:glycosyltransferase n=1 Tax=Stenotrophomonas terrae TaxID=405446 RepID=UPI00320B353D